MIIRCERCDTRFRLDDTRIPALGARVRCSICKHAFFVQPPGASSDDTVHVLAEEAAAAEHAPAPPPSWDLEDESQRGAAALPELQDQDSAEADGPRQPPARSSEEESEWEFERTLPPAAPASSAPAPPPELEAEPEAALEPEAANESEADPAAPEPVEAPAEGESSSLEGLGDPQSWDLTADADAESEPLAAGEGLEDPGALLDFSDEFDTDALSATAEEVESDEPPSATTAPHDRGMAGVALARSAVQALGWLGVVVLSGLAAWGSLRPTPERAVAALERVAGFDVIGLRARTVENATAGDILVVSGRLQNPGPGPRRLDAALAVTLLDEAGAPVEGPAALAGPALSESLLREADPRWLRAQQQAQAPVVAETLLRAGESLAFDAVFERLPGRAARFTLATEALPAGETNPFAEWAAEALPTPTGRDRELDADAGAGGERPSGTDLPSTALPSSE